MLLLKLIKIKLAVHVWYNVKCSFLVCQDLKCMLSYFLKYTSDD